jgi:hypothetical protein
MCVECYSCIIVHGAIVQDLCLSVKFTERLFMIFGIVGVLENATKKKRKC